MAKRDRSRGSVKQRKENVRNERKVVGNRELMTFSLKYLDQTQPADNPETIELWEKLGLLNPLFRRLKEISQLSRHEAINQQQIKAYGDFPPEGKTSFYHPSHVDQHVEWGVIEGMGGKPRVAGFISESTFYIVFLDSEHKFWISEKKNT